LLEEVLDSGMALKKLKELVKSQKGKISQIDHPDLLPKSKYQGDIVSVKKGYIDKVDARIIGEASMLLGAGRVKKDDKIDLSVGIILKKKKGHWVESKDVMATLYYNDENKFDIAKVMVKNAFHIVDQKPEDKPLILSVIDQYGIKKVD